ncbi:MAG: putative Ig domain-containing protein [Methylobacter sp.]
MDQIIESAAGGNDTVESSITYMLGDSLENLALTGLEDLNAFGNSGNNLITGNSGNNRIDGGQGADTMAGGAGNDVYVTDNEGDRINESAGQGIDTVERTNDTLLILDNNVENLMLMGTVVHGNGNDLDNAITGNGADNILMGLGGNDTLEGGAGNDALFGGTGADTLIGGTGEDYYQVDDVGDIVIEAAGEGGDFVRSSMSYTLTDNVESLALDGTVDLAATGNGLNNGLWGNAGNNTLSGLAGNDYLVGQAGNDVYLFGRGDGLDTIDNTDLLIATDTLRFGAGIADTDVLALQSGTDLVLKIKGGSDQIDVYNYYGADTITGNNVYDHKIDRVEFANGVVWDQAALQVQVDRSTYNHSPTVNAYLPTLQSYVDTLFSYTVPADTIVDSDAGDSISYSTTLADGSALPSWLSFDAASRTFSGTPSASQVGSLSFILWGTDNYGYSAGEYVTLTTALPNHAPVLSNALADQSASQGAAFTYTVPAGAFTDPDAGDTLSYGATLADGSTLPSWLAFNASTRAFSGTPTTLGSVSVRVTATDAGGLKVSDVFDIVVSVQNLALNGTSGADSLIGGYGNDTLNGLAGNDTLIGSAGNDVLDGGAGNDSLKGGVGDDIYIVDSTADVVVENVNEGLDVVQAGVSYVLTNNVENLLLIGTSAISGTGNALDNILTGNSAANTLTGGAGNDRLDGKGGADKLIGGTGNDVYVVDVATDAITENANEGTDTVESGVTFTLGSNLENLVLMGATAINGTGNTLNNVLIGNSAANTLSGGTGADTMNGVAGDDVYVVDNIWDVVSENPNEGNDLVQAGVTYTLAADVENLTLTGTNAINGTGNMLGNTIIGNTAANILNGGVGNDTLTGGSGADRFQFTTTLGTDNIDTITDFVSGTDKIDLSKAIFTAFGSLTVGSSLGNAEIGNHVLYDAATGFLCYDADGSAGAGAAVQILLLGTTNHPATLKGGDFIIAA